jgi:formiminotetrahydrofolate cyclodeaminase
MAALFPGSGAPQAWCYTRICFAKGYGPKFIGRKPKTVSQSDVDETIQPAPLADQSLRDLVGQVADPARHAGGGVIVGMTLAGAAASAELVLRLAVKRKSLASRRDEIAQLLENVASARRTFEGAADEDMAAFEELVAVQRSVKQLPQPDSEEALAQLNDAYVRAASVPLSFARHALELMRTAEAGLEFASRFTVSDIGAAAALANGALEAALLTVSANLAYVDDATAEATRAEMVHIEEEASAVTVRVLRRATEVISGQPVRRA